MYENPLTKIEEANTKLTFINNYYDISICGIILHSLSLSKMILLEWDQLFVSIYLK